MKVFAEYYCDSTGWNGSDFSGPVKLIPALGSDGYCPLDGRLSISRLHIEAKKKLASIRAVRPHIRAYRLMRGDLRSSRPASQIVEVPE